MLAGFLFHSPSTLRQQPALDRPYPGVNASGGYGRRFDGHAMQTAGSLLATSGLSTVQPPSMTGVGATRAIRQAFLAAWKSAGAVSGGIRLESPHLFALPTYDVIRRKNQGRRVQVAA